MGVQGDGLPDWALRVGLGWTGGERGGRQDGWREGRGAATVVWVELELRLASSSGAQ